MDRIATPVTLDLRIGAENKTIAMDGTQIVQNLGGDLVHVTGSNLDRKPFARFQAIRVQKIADHPVGALDVVQNPRAVFLKQDRIFRPTEHQLGAHLHGRERGAEIVTQDRDESLVPPSIRPVLASHLEYRRYTRPSG